MIRSLVLVAIASPAAAEVLQLPQGCTPIASVQHRECQVSLHYRCDGAPGYASVSAAEDGLGWITQRDEGGQWVGMIHVPSGYEFETVNTSDPSEHRRVLAEGRDAYRYTMEHRQSGYSETYVGTNELVGAVEIDGERLLKVAYDYRVIDVVDAEIRAMTGWAYFWGDEPVSFPGSWSSSVGQSSAAEPVEILTEGEVGFMDMTPRYDCGEEMS